MRRRKTVSSVYDRSTIHLYQVERMPLMWPIEASLLLLLLLLLNDNLVMLEWINPNRPLNVASASLFHCPSIDTDPVVALILIKRSTLPVYKCHLVGLKICLLPDPLQSGASKYVVLHWIGSNIIYFTCHKNPQHQKTDKASSHGRRGWLESHSAPQDIMLSANKPLFCYNLFWKWYYSQLFQCSAHESPIKSASYTIRDFTAVLWLY